MRNLLWIESEGNWWKFNCWNFLCEDMLKMYAHIRNIDHQRSPVQMNQCPSVAWQVKVLETILIIWWLALLKKIFVCWKSLRVTETMLIPLNNEAQRKPKKNKWGLIWVQILLISLSSGWDDHIYFSAFIICFLLAIELNTKFMDKWKNKNKT